MTLSLQAGHLRGLQGWPERLSRSHHAAGKNTSEIALALDALEALFDHRADTFFLVISASDFAYLCRKFRERGATVCIVGEAKTPDALRNASDQFFEWNRAEHVLEHATEQIARPAGKSDIGTKSEPVKAELTRPIVKRRPRFVVDAVSLLADGTSEGKVS